MLLPISWMITIESLPGTNSFKKHFFSTNATTALHKSENATYAINPRSAYKNLKFVSILYVQIILFNFTNCINGFEIFTIKQINSILEIRDFT